MFQPPRARASLLFPHGGHFRWAAVGCDQNLRAKSGARQFRTMLLDSSKTPQEVNHGLVIGSYQKLP